MALRIGQGQASSFPAMMAEEPQAPPVEAPIEAPTPQDELASVEEAMEPRMGMAKVSPEAARYFGPEYRCGSCVHFMEGMQGGECEIVAGPIDPEGVCGLFEPDAGMLAEPADLTMEEPVEEPIEEPVPAEDE